LSLNQFLRPGELKLRKVAENSLPDATLGSATGQSLAGKTIMLTRPRAQSGEMAGLLTGLGANVIYCPTIEIAAPGNWEALDAAIERLETYDWLVFTSANGSEYFFARLAEKRPDRPLVMTSQITCAIGPATAKAIQSTGAQVDVIATDSTAEGALKTIIEYAGGEDKICGLRILIPRARVAREVLPDELTKLGAHVDAVEAYQTIKPAVDRDNLVAMFSAGRIDAITFTSSSTIKNFAAIVGMDDLSTLLHRVAVACIGPITAQTAAEHGLTTVIQPEAYNATALVEALVVSLRRS
jgi:uroporphyrinogen III methyltransferase / synthase